MIKKFFALISLLSLILFTSFSSVSFSLSKEKPPIKVEIITSTNSYTYFAYFSEKFHTFYFCNKF